MPITQYRIVNPGAADVYYNVAGTAYDSSGDFTNQVPSSQPTINSGRAIGLYSNRTLLNTINHGILSTVYGSQVYGGLWVAKAAWGSAVTGATVAASSGFAQYTKASHGLTVGTVVNVTDTNSKVTGPQRVTAVTANTFTTNKAYTSGAGTLTYRAGAGTHFASMSAEKYVMRRVTTELAGGISKTTLRSGASDYQIRRSIQKMEAMRTTRVATAIRAGYWNEYSGSWSTAPTTADDISTFGTDQAATVSRSAPGELVYKEPKPVPKMADYPAKTG